MKATLVSKGERQKKVGNCFCMVGPILPHIFGQPFAKYK
jgi:hypothetical protein